MDSEPAAIRLLSRLQVLAAGGDDHLIGRRIHSGEWVTLAKGVFGLPSWPLSFRRQLMIAVLEAGPGAVVCREAAALIHGLTGYRQLVVCVVVAHGDHQHLRSGRLDQLTDLDATDVVMVGGLPVTSRARTIVDLAARGRRRLLSDALDDEVAAGRLSVGDVRAVFDRVARRGKPGVRLMRSILEEREAGEEIAGTKLERTANRVLRAAGYEVRWQVPFPGKTHDKGRIDGLIAGTRVIVEVDGRRWHTRVRDFERDKVRDIELQAAGYIPVRVSYWILKNDPDWLLDRLATICGQAESLARERVPAFSSKYLALGARHLLENEEKGRVKS